MNGAGAGGSRTGQVPSSDPRMEPPVGTGLPTALRIWEDGLVGEEVAT